MKRLAVLLATALAFASVQASASAQIKQWGSLFDGLGGESYTLQLPTGVSGLEKVVAIDAGNATSYALESGGTVWAWGDGAVGELGDGGTADSPSTPQKVVFPAGTPPIVAIGEARDEGYAIDSSGQGWAWGHNGTGSLCLGKEGTGVQLLPRKVPGITTAVQVQGGEEHVLWLLANGTVEACGSNLEGQLGVGEAVDISHVALAVPGLSKIVEISAGERTSAARNAAGQLFMWGGNKTGAIGVGGPSMTVAYTPVQVPLPGPASQVSAGGDFSENNHTLAIVNGQVYGWGEDRNGEVGDGSTADKFSPVATGLRYTKIVASGKCSLGLDAKGGVWAWGSGEEYDLGDGDTDSAFTPVKVDSGASMISGTARNSLDG